MEPAFYDAGLAALAQPEGWTLLSHGNYLAGNGSDGALRAGRGRSNRRRTLHRAQDTTQATLLRVLARGCDLGAALISVTTGRGARRSRAARRARRRILGARRRSAPSRRRSRGYRAPRRAAGSRPPGPAGAAKPESARSRARRGPRR